MNPDAQQYFRDNPTEPYWYYSRTLRVVNLALKPWLKPFVPWPDERIHP